ncbi:Putative fatty-acid--CoA ligase FadD21 [Acaryochloris thomasi RCC1774]|uniref:Fatty-acid--CoA ligase FadD21 n=1 Tax=Acaryochloris thomasi RCC1774 TaxID=1764569 RepID=A0A2W1JS64_9CYAN|nr:fatty acyl-AMP ligase [Acaryochloris thomasi]PZD71871.1 Putative fatty-acid--CoA ligase FadD21 [Acaryochloris thomasi RCC1774]
MQPFESPPQVETLVELLRHRASRQPEQVAYTFLVDGEDEKIQWSYADLDRWADAIATHLQPLTEPGARILLLYPPGLDYIAAFFGCLYAGMIAVPAYPPRPNRSLERLETIAANSGATVVLTLESILENLNRRIAEAPILERLTWRTTDALPPLSLQKALDLTSDSLAFLQYTSGSTATPKGVKISHGNLLHNLKSLHRCFEVNEQSKGVFWLPLYHDMGLIGGVLQPLYSGRPAVLMPPLMFIQKPVRWLAAISREQATISGGPNFAYDLCIKKITEEQRATLDLSHWTLAFNGAESINPDTLDAFAKTFAPCGFRKEAFYPCYGMAEATLFISGGLKSQPPVLKTIQAEALTESKVVEAQPQDARRQTLVSCGRSLFDQTLKIVDPETQQCCRASEIGEIWVSGPSIAQGYWQQPEQTAETFAAYLNDSGPFLRTGDLGFLANGDVFFAGRLKDVIVLNGKNYYPQDIEATLDRCMPELQISGAAVFTVPVEGTEQLTALIEVDRRMVSRCRQPEESEVLFTTFRKAVWSTHELLISAFYLLKPGGLPRTSSGKIQRYLCRERVLAGGGDAIATSNSGP